MFAGEAGVVGIWSLKHEKYDNVQFIYQASIPNQSCPYFLHKKQETSNQAN